MTKIFKLRLQEGIVGSMFQYNMFSGLPTVNIVLFQGKFQGKFANYSPMGVCNRKCVILQTKKQGVHIIFNLLNEKSISSVCSGKASLFDEKPTASV